MGSIKNGVIWTSGEKLLTQLVQFILGIIIARLITPQEYGVLGIILVFINISQVFIDSGLGSALIYRNNLDKRDIQTTFSFNFIVSLILCVLLCLGSPFIEDYFKLEGLISFLRIASLVLIFNSFVIVPTCILKIKQNFKAISIANFASTLMSGVLGVILAYAGYGVWALIIQLLSRSILLMILITIQSRWLPDFSFSRKSFDGLWKYSANLLTSHSLTKFVEEGVSFIVGKALTPYSLGLFTRGLQFASLPNGIIGSVLSTVMFPALSSYRQDEALFYQTYRKTIIIQSILIPPIYIGLAIISEPLVFLLLGEKWMDVVPVLQIFCFGKFIFSLANTTEHALCSLGYSNIALKQQMYKMLVKLVLILFALRWGLMAVVIANAVADFSAYFITNFCGRKLLLYSMKKQIKDVCIIILAALFAGACGYLSSKFINFPLLKIMMTLIISLLIYVSFLFVMKKLQLNSVKFNGGIHLSSNNKIL